MFLSLEKELQKLTTETVSDRVVEFQKNVKKGVYIVGACGFPITYIPHNLMWGGYRAKADVLKWHISHGLGLSGMLTYMNKSSLSSKNMGGVCEKLGHDWGYKWMSLSLLFVGYDPMVELALTRHSKFYMSWVVGEQQSKIFMASGSIKDWVKYTKNKDDNTFDMPTRESLKNTSDILDALGVNNAK